MNMMSIFWLVLLVVFIGVEAGTAGLVSIWFAAGSLAAMIVALIWPSAILAQIVVATLVSAACLLALRPLARNLVGGRKVATNADANIGRQCQVVQEIQPGRHGRVKLEGLEWMAVSDYTMPVGTWGTVVAIEGAKVIVMPCGMENTPPQQGAANGPPPEI